MRTTLRLTRVLGVLAIVATVAACGSSNHASSTSSTQSTNGASASSTPQAAGAPIKVGVICNCSGPFGSTIAAAGQVSKAWGNAVNAAGGLNGHPIQLTETDDMSNPGTSVTAAQAMIASHVDVIVDESNFDAAWESAVAAAGIPVVGGNFSSTPFYTNPDFYPSGQTNDSITYANVAVAKQAGAKNLGNLYCAEAPQCQQSVPLIKTAGQQLGVPAVYSASISATAPNYTAQCVAAQQAHVTGLFIGDSATVIAKVAQNCSQQSFTPTYITEGTGFSMLLASTPGLKDHLWSNYPILPFFDNAAPVQRMNAALDKYYPGLRNNTTAFSEYAAQAWTAGVLIEHAVKASNLSASDTPTPAGIKTGLDSLKADTLDGWSPPLTFVAGQPHKVDCWFVARLQNGTPALVDSGKLSCQSGSPS